MKLILTVLAFLLAVIVHAQVYDSAGDSRTVLLRSADSLIGNYQFEKALALLEKNTDTTDIRLLQLKGQCSFRLGLTSAAIQNYECILGMDSVNRSALNQLGQLYSRENEFAKAQECYWRLIAVDSTNSYYYKQCAFHAAKSEDIIMAKSLYERTLELNPSDIEATLALGTILMDMELFDVVDSVLTQAFARDPENKALRLMHAKCLFEQQKFPEVVANVNWLLTQTDTVAAYARLLGASYFQLHDYKNVEVCMDFLIRHNYESEWIYYYMGVAHKEMGDTQGSIGWLKKAVDKSISENTATYYSQLATSYEEVKDYANAIKAYRAAYETSKEGILLYHLARNYDIYYKDKSQAVTYYKWYLASDDTIRLAKEYSKRRIQTIGR